MNLDTLIEILNDYREEFGGDAEVRLMTQQNCPSKPDLRRYQRPRHERCVRR